MRIQSVLLVVVCLFLVLVPVAHAQDFSESYYCNNTFLRWLFSLDCSGYSSSPEPIQEQSPGSLQLRFFTPPITLVPIAAPTATPRACTYTTVGECNGLCGGTCILSNGCYECPADIIPTPACIYESIGECNGLCGDTCVLTNGCYACPADITPTPTNIPGVPTPTGIPGSATSTPTPTTPSGNSGSNTEQVDWVYDGVGRCWSSWAGASCSLLPHEGGEVDALRDLDGDGSPDVTCSQGSGDKRRTTITNDSDSSLVLSCEKYVCNSCQSGNGTHAQCDRGIDPSASREREIYTITPGCTATCTILGAYGSCLDQKDPPAGLEDPEPEPTSTPHPAGPTPTSRPSSPGSCAYATGHCSVENLMKPEFFGSQEKAEKASMICNKESGGDPFAANKQCLSGGTYDYSIGLFQINLIAHCSSAISGNAASNSCRILNQAELTACETRFKDPDENIKYAVQLSSNGTNWNPWANAKNICNIQN